MVDRLVIASVGFDERFIVRLMVSCSLGVGSYDHLLLVMPSGDDVRCSGVVDSVKAFISNYELKLGLDVVTVDVAGFWSSAGTIRKTIENLYSKLEPKELIVLLSGGMRALIMEVLVGCIATGLKGQVLVYREDLKGHIEFPLEILNIEKPTIEHTRILKIIHELGGSANLKDIKHKLKISKATAHRKIKELENMNIVRIEHRGRASKILLTEKAKLWI